MRAWLVAVVAASVLGIWLIAVTFLAPLHRAIFAVVPADGVVVDQDRVTVDNGVVRFLLGGSTTQDLTTTEWDHLLDVRLRLELLSALGLVGLVLIFVGRPSRKEIVWAAIAIVGCTLGSLIFFQPFFVAFHQVVFPAGNWELPSSQFLITRVYPAGFFAAAWLVIGTGSAATLWLWRFLPSRAREQGR